MTEPPRTTTASGASSSLPGSPAARAIGKRPGTAVNAVMRIGASRSCEPCHHRRLAPLLVEGARDEIEARLFAIRPHFDPGSSFYVDPSELDPGQQQAYDVVRFNYEFVTSDRSFGSHNINYARALLTVTEAFLGIAP